MGALYIYQASAGSGKTYLLVKTYLMLAFKSPANFQRILAVTFTNRATHEMKDRILSTLAGLAQGEWTPYTDFLCSQYGWNVQTLQKQARLVLSDVLHRYDYFNVTTIDSFLQTVVRHFARELSLPYYFSLQLEVEPVLESLIEKVVQKAEQDVSLRDWLVQFGGYNLASGKPWFFKRALKELGYQLFTEEFAVQEKALLEALQEPARLTNFLQGIDTNLFVFEHFMQSIGKDVLAIITAEGLGLQDFSYGERGVMGYFHLLAEKKKFVPTQRTLKALESVEAWYSRSKPDLVKEKIKRVVTGRLLSLLGHSIAYYEENYRAYVTAKALKPFIYGFGIFTHLVESLQDLRKEDHLMLVSDAAYLLRKLIADNETPFFYEKIGAFYDHFLIDEFQDVSGFQWQNFKPLVQNSVAAGYQSLVVGDTKQSIYRWRGGDWRLLAGSLKKELNTAIEQVLSDNWRSKPAIIKFNNQFFLEAVTYLFDGLRADLGELDQVVWKEGLLGQLEEIERVYTRSYQTVPQPKLDARDGGGFVSIKFFQPTGPDSASTSWKEGVYEALPALVEGLQRDGFSLEEVAILVRSHAEEKEIVNLLLDYQQSEKALPGFKYTAFSRESFCLGASPYIQLIMAALRCILDPRDVFARTEVVYFYLSYVRSGQMNFSLSNHFLQQIKQGDLKEFLPAAFLGSLPYFSTLPLYQCIEGLIRVFQIHLTAGLPLVQALQEEVYAYLEEQPGAGIYEFLMWWGVAGYKKSLGAVKDQQGMCVMTIHQAKGLQFKVVIVPFCAWSLDHAVQKAPFIWCHGRERPFDAFQSVPLRYHKALQQTVYAEDYYRECMQVHLDHFNLLYVAFTRAQERLYVFAPVPERLCKDTAGLLYKTVHTILPVDDLPSVMEEFLFQ